MGKSGNTAGTVTGKAGAGGRGPLGDGAGRTGGGASGSSDLIANPTGGGSKTGGRDFLEDPASHASPDGVKDRTQDVPPDATGATISFEDAPSDGERYIVDSFPHSGEGARGTGSIARHFICGGRVERVVRRAGLKIVRTRRAVVRIVRVRRWRRR